MDHVEFQFTEIIPEIILGTNLCCKAHGTKLQAMGVLLDISLEEAKIELPEGISFLWLPVEDDAAPTDEQLFLGTSALVEAVEKGIKTYVHCRLGHGRSPTLVIAYFIRTGMSFDDAHKLVKNKRPEIHLSQVQEKRLRIFESQCDR